VWSDFVTYAEEDRRVFYLQSIYIVSWYFWLKQRLVGGKCFFLMTLKDPNTGVGVQAKFIATAASAKTGEETT